MAPLFVETKVRGPVEKFNERWDLVIAGRPMNEEFRDPNQGDLELVPGLAA